MSRTKLLITVMALLVIPSLAAGQMVPPPAHGSYLGGWGYNPTKWDAISGSWSSGFTMYCPTGPLGGAGWFVDWTDPANPVYIDYGDITLELWIEMYMIQTYQWTDWQWHRLGNEAEHICFNIGGTIQSNEGVWILMTADPAYDPNFLTFQGNIGVGDDRNVRNIPITYRGRWGDGFVVGNNVVQGWTALTWAGGDLILAELEACDHWFEFEGCFDLVYHEADGYYKLVLAGCPAPTL